MTIPANRALSWLNTHCCVKALLSVRSAVSGLQRALLRRLEEMTPAVLTTVLQEEIKDKTSAPESKRSARCQNQASGSGWMFCVWVVGLI